jgi:hypothetical protein
LVLSQSGTGRGGSRSRYMEHYRIADNLLSVKAQIRQLSAAVDGQIDRVHSSRDSSSSGYHTTLAGNTSSTTSSASRTEATSNSSSTSRKRLVRSDGRGSSEDDELGNNGERNNNPKRPKGTGAGGAEPTMTPSCRFACPFRKRNRTRFNIRTHEACVKAGYWVMSLLKRHIKDCHIRPQLPHKCPRCFRGFASIEELRRHQRLPLDQMCQALDLLDEPTGFDPEDGISGEVLSMLRDRKGPELVTGRHCGAHCSRRMISGTFRHQVWLYVMPFQLNAVETLTLLPRIRISCDN